MPDPLAEFKNALDLVPMVLLGTDDARVAQDARTAADVLTDLTQAHVSAVLVGCTGVGKSFLVNGLAGREVSEASVIRPTTTSVVTAAAYGPVWSDQQVNQAIVPATTVRLDVVDTPPWELGDPDTRRVLADADLAILVVSPARYADAATQSCWEAVAACPHRLIVLNRQRGTPDERSEVLTSVKGRFAVPFVAVVEEAGDTSQLLNQLLSRISDGPADKGRTTIARTTAANAARHIAGTVTSGAIDLHRLEVVIESVANPRIADRVLTVRESWSATAQAVVEVIEGLLDDLDREIVSTFGNGLASRVLTEIGEWRSSDVEAALAAWRIDVAARFRSAASVRWRRSATHQMIDDASWKLGVNRSVVVSKRVGRVMGADLGTATAKAHELLGVIAESAMDQRIGDWLTSVEDVGSYKPGELLAAANALGNWDPWRIDG